MSGEHIRNRETFVQIHLFDGLKRRRNIMPTDIDGAYDVGGKAFVFLEGKTGNVKMEDAQRNFYTALVNSIIHPAILIVYNHYHPSNEDVDVAGSKVMVREVYSNTKKEWVQMKQGTKVVTVLDNFENKYCKGL